MPLLTAREAEARRAAAPVGAPAPEAVPAPAPEADGRRFRMLHPDSTESYPISCEFELDGEAVRIERGVAVVSAAAATKLEASGWYRGREVS